MLAWAKDIKATTKLRWNRVHKFQLKTRISIEFGSYRLKTAETVDELIESFRLRHDVFFREFQGTQKPGLDVDKFDWEFDHLLILHGNRIVGTYRLGCMPSSEGSYTGLEFDLANVFCMDGPFLELGRACIHKDHRRGAVISLLWRGIAEYMNRSGANVLFGCSSLKINDPRSAALVYKHLESQNALLPAGTATPTKPFQMRGFRQELAKLSNGLSVQEQADAEDLLPSLLKSYLKLGAKIAGEPAYDRDFNCVDLLTILRKDELGDSLARRFQVVR